MINSPEITAFISKYSPYLREARRRVLYSFLVFGIALVAGFFFYENIIRFLIGSLALRGVNVVFTSPFQFINLAISSGVTSGLVAAVPFFIAQILYFLKPALRKKEFVKMTRFLPFSLILFITGFAFGAWVIRWQIQVFLAKSAALGIGNVIDIRNLLTTVLMTSALMGVGFQFPIILLLLMRFGILKHQQISRWRMWFYLGSFIFTVVLPADSVLVDALLFLPLVILFEITLVLGGIGEKRRVGAIGR